MCKKIPVAFVGIILICCLFSCSSIEKPETCAFGAVGSAAIVEVTGIHPSQVCQEYWNKAGQFYKTEPQPNKTTVCVVDDLQYNGYSYKATVRDTGLLNLVGNSICTQLEAGSKTLSANQAVPSPVIPPSPIPTLTSVPVPTVAEISTPSAGDVVPTVPLGNNVHEFRHSYMNSAFYYSDLFWYLTNNKSYGLLINRTIPNCEIYEQGGHGLPDNVNPQPVVINDITWETIPWPPGALFYTQSEINFPVIVYLPASNPGLCTTEIYTVLGTLHATN